VIAPALFLPLQRTSSGKPAMNLDRDRVRSHTAAAVLRRIDDATVASLTVHAAAGSHAVGQRLIELDREWDVDRTIEVEAATMGLIGVALGAFVNRSLLAMPALVAASVLTYALTGRYPLLPLFRRLGVRTAREIARERYALKALRGDFHAMDSDTLVIGGEAGSTRAAQHSAPADEALEAK
jgi:hypothetical protein